MVQIKNTIQIKYTLNLYNTNKYIKRNKKQQAIIKIPKFTHCPLDTLCKDQTQSFLSTQIFGIEGK